MFKEKVKNDLFITRNQRRLTRQQVTAMLGFLGYRTTSALEKYEQGTVLPPLRTALALEIIYRKPVAFLWPELYRELREGIRSQETESTAAEMEGYV